MFLFQSDWTLAARGGARIKLHIAGTANSRISNHAKDVIFDPNVEGGK
jgi:hypothetical protein